MSAATRRARRVFAGWLVDVAIFAAFALAAYAILFAMWALA